MKERMVTDTAFANSIKAVWKSMLTSEPKPPPPDKEGTIAFFLKNLEKFEARGGKVILLRSPSDGFFDELERMITPRPEFWEELVAQANTPAIHYQDYDKLKNFKTIEWSHLSATDADIFTRNLVEILLEENLITNLKTN